jgi:hypothetical protein
MELLTLLWIITTSSYFYKWMHHKNVI